ncbi:putative DNA modification/repair radical SAM protein [Hominifimenecus sp. rT4P-3]|uniref:putative DNA modification/repair radical SAM protein n=1 Tax=Hominifimenecus sp. rT4P-3 TaxID=3242979 RepID=UPI003DA4ABC1
MLIQENLSLQQKLEILADAAKYDVACTSSGVDRKGRKDAMGSAVSCGICHSFAADGRCVSLLKILLTNECIYDCKYCVNRISNDTVRTSFTPEEICTLTMEFYRRNYIEGLFLSSGILRTPDYTMEQIYQTLWQLREVHRFWGYIHVKAIPGADPALLERVGHLADRMSINLELPTGDGLRKLAPGKTREKILTPMRQIQHGIHDNRLKLEDKKREKKIYLPGSSEKSGAPALVSKKAGPLAPKGMLRYEEKSKFVPAGQSTQMIIGATPETDHQILSVTEALYHRFELKRVFFSAYTAINEDSSLPALGTKPPLLREHRLYQADWLLRFYGFEAGELLTEEKPFFNEALDPKCDWALRHLELFPVEINRADYMTLLRVPGIGVKSARRILQARRSAKLDFSSLKKFGVVLKRAAYFITCEGKMMGNTPIEEDFLTRALTAEDRIKNQRIADADTFRQLSLFDDFHVENAEPRPDDVWKSLSGQL